MVANKELSDKDYVSLEAAKALKGIGYNVPTHTHFHIRDDKVYVGLSSNPEHWGDEYENMIDRPILQKAKEYLRDVRCVSLRISKSLLTGQWFYRQSSRQGANCGLRQEYRSEEHTSELQSQR